jgi:hypothetical protein
MYTLYTSTGEVVRNSDLVVVAPTTNDESQDYLDYITWVNEGNEPTLGDGAVPSQLLETRARVWKEIQAERDRRKSNGVKVGDNWFHTDDASRIQQIGLVMFGVNLPPGILWKTLSGNFVPMTPTLAMQIFMGVAASDIAIFAVAEQHKGAMLASQNPREYNYLSGWPLTFGE